MLTLGQHSRRRHGFKVSRETVRKWMQVVNYVATMKLSAITDRNETFAEWWAEFEAGDGQTDHRHRFVENDVFIGGYRALEASFPT